MPALYRLAGAQPDKQRKFAWHRCAAARGVLSAETRLFDAFARQVFNDVDVFAATIIALARIAFGIFVCQAGALRRHHSAAGKFSEAISSILSR